MALLSRSERRLPGRERLLPDEVQARVGGVVAGELEIEAVGQRGRLADHHRRVALLEDQQSVGYRVGAAELLRLALLIEPPGVLSVSRKLGAMTDPSGRLAFQSPTRAAAVSGRDGAAAGPAGAKPGALGSAGGVPGVSISSSCADKRSFGLSFTVAASSVAAASAWPQMV